MKKIFYILIPLFLLGTFKSSAQSFNIQEDTVKALMQDYLIDLPASLRNLTNDTIRISWKVIDHNIPTDWADSGQFGLCDNVLCYYKTILSGSTQVTDTITANGTMSMKAQINGESPGITSTGTYYFTVEAVNGSTTDTIVYTISNWTTSVANVSNNQNVVTLYPNPARDILNVQYDKNAGIRNISIHNLVGKQVASFRVNGSGNSVKLDINNIPSGVYFLRLKDNTGRVTATRRFTHQ